MNKTPTIANVKTFISTSATDQDLDDILDIIKIRRKILESLKQVTIKVGDKVSLDNIRPKALCGILGVIKEIKGKRITVTLSEQEALKIAGIRYGPKWGHKGDYDLTGVPVSCIREG